MIRDLCCSVNFFSDFCLFQDLFSGKVKAIGRENDGLYILVPRINAVSGGLIAYGRSVDVSLWQKRLAHASSGAMRQLLGVKLENCRNVIDSYGECPLAKHTRLPFPISTTKTAAIFYLLHLDVWGPYHTSTFDGNKFFLTVVDDYSHMTWVFLLKFKSDMIIVLRDFFRMIKVNFKQLCR